MKTLRKSVSQRPRTCPFTGFSCAYPCCELKRARMRLSLSDSAIAQELDVARSTWWRYRQGHQKPPRAVCWMLHVLEGHFPWRGWTRFFVNTREQKLYIEDWRYGVDLQALRLYWWEIKSLRALRTDYEALWLEHLRSLSPVAGKSVKDQAA